MIKKIHKKEGCKLIKVAFDLIENKISKIQIDGDFFLYPEEGIELINEGLIDEEYDLEAIKNKVDKIISVNSIKLYGITSEAIAESITKT